MAKRGRKSRSVRRVGSSNSFMNDAKGIGGYVLWQVFAVPRIAPTVSPQTLAFGELIAGYMLKNKAGMLGSTARFAYMLNLYKIGSGILIPMVGGIASAGGAQNAFNGY